VRLKILRRVTAACLSVCLSARTGPRLPLDGFCEIYYWWTSLNNGEKNKIDENHKNDKSSEHTAGRRKCMLVKMWLDASWVLVCGKRNVRLIKTSKCTKCGTWQYISPKNQAVYEII